MKKNIVINTDSQFYQSLARIITQFNGQPEDINLLNQITMRGAHKADRHFIFELGQILAEAGMISRKEFSKKTVKIDYRLSLEKLLKTSEKESREEMIIFNPTSNSEEIEKYFAVTEDKVKEKTIILIKFNKFINNYKELKKEIEKAGYLPVGPRELIAYLQSGTDFPGRWYSGKSQIGALGKLCLRNGNIRTFLCAQKQGWYEGAIMLKSRVLAGGISPHFYWACEEK